MSRTRDKLERIEQLIRLKFPTVQMPREQRLRLSALAEHKILQKDTLLHDDETGSRHIIEHLTSGHTFGELAPASIAGGLYAIETTEILQINVQKWLESDQLPESLQLRLSLDHLPPSCLDSIDFTLLPFQIIEFDPDETLLLHSDTHESILFLIEGKAKATKTIGGKTYVIQDFEEGDHFPGVPVQMWDVAMETLDKSTFKASLTLDVGYTVTASTRALVLRMKLLDLVPQCNETFFNTVFAKNLYRPESEEVMQQVSKQHRWEAFKKQMITPN
ncbi:hypothetical protein EDD86DRAFT_249133 [Gorgonomyces haynaldii]|nr:hypothetical protein EDD86DRAFT_249133 [Gorgonomyces haynaldii]